MNVCVKERKREGERVREEEDKLGLRSCRNVAQQVDIPANSAHKYRLLPVVYLQFRPGPRHKDVNDIQPLSRLE